MVLVDVFVVGAEYELAFCGVGEEDVAESVPDFGMEATEVEWPNFGFADRN